MNICVLIPVLLPWICGAVTCLFFKKKDLHIFADIAMILSAVFTFVVNIRFLGEGEFVLFYLMKDMPIMFKIDNITLIFALIAAVCFTAAMIYSSRYIEKDNGYYGFMLLSYGALMAIDMAGNLVTGYAFFEMLTLMSFPLVLRNKTHESITAALKYLLYSLCGAYMGLFAIYVLYHNTSTLTYTAGGTLLPGALELHPNLLLVAIFVALIGFGVKAGMFPLHAWLPTAHPVAPAPASGVLSGVIVKAGVLMIIRVVFYVFGAENLRGTWVQTVWIILTLVTVFMGSLLAFREDVLKKRLAYSTVSQVSYILFGLAVLNGEALSGSLWHVIFHAFIKCALFLCAGAFIHETGKEKVSELTGIGKKMPITTTLFTVASLGLIGIPPTGGFISKWYLAVGALGSDTGAFRFIGPAILLVSALLTAGYLLPVTVKGFFPGSDFDYESNPRKEASPLMWVPILILVILVVVGGLFPEKISDFYYMLLMNATAKGV